MGDERDVREAKKKQRMHSGCKWVHSNQQQREACAGSVAVPPPVHTAVKSRDRQSQPGAGGRLLLMSRPNLINKIILPCRPDSVHLVHLAGPLRLSLRLRAWEGPIHLAEKPNAHSSQSTLAALDSAMPKRRRPAVAPQDPHTNCGTAACRMLVIGRQVANLTTTQSDKRSA